WIQEDDNLKIVYQVKNDGYTRTLEEAILCKLLNMEITDKPTNEEWKNKRKNSRLKFSIPRNGESRLSVRDIVESSRNNKADFMHSLILTSNDSEDYIKSLPNYIERGLEWLI